MTQKRLLRWAFFVLGLALLTGCVVENTIKSIPILGSIYRFPDIDQHFVDIPIINLLISHRSILTHNALIPLAVAWCVRHLNYWGIGITGVVGSLFALHFLLDLFPKKWYGYAFIHLPVLGWLDWIPFGNLWIPTIFSILWLSLNMLLSLFAFVIVLRAKV